MANEPLTAEEEQRQLDGGLPPARLRELLAELSLIDIGRLLLAKAAGPEGLSLQGAARLDMSTAACALTVRRLPPKRAKRVTRG